MPILTAMSAPAAGRPSMPRRDDLPSVLVIGSGPIVIGQACEFDYSGTQACRVLKAEGIRVILVNSNPATIMTDPEFADATYIEPITTAVLESIIEKERPDAILPTLGGQTALNAAAALHDAGVLDFYNVELIGAKIEAITLGENREEFKKVVTRCGAESRPIVHLSLDRRLCFRRHRTVLPSGREAVLHHGRPGFGDCVRRSGPSPDCGGRPSLLPDDGGAARGVDTRVEGV